MCVWDPVYRRCEHERQVYAILAFMPDECRPDEYLTRFSAGEAILYRGLDEKQRLTSVLPVRVVADDQDQIVL